MGKRKILLTKKEQRFIKKLQTVLANPPASLWLFGWSGTLVLLKKDDTGFPCVVEDSFGIQGDGGDPTETEVDQEAEVERD